MKEPPHPPIKTAIGAAGNPEERRVYIPDSMPLRRLAEQLHLNPFRIISDAMEEGEFHSLDSKVGFVMAEKIALKHGFIPIRKNEH